jgi:membrane protease YdiL (CAAX protease family)
VANATRRPVMTVADILRSGVPLALLVAAAAVRPVAPVVLVVLILGLAVAVNRDAPVRWSWAAPIPVAASLSWGLIAAPTAGAGGIDCALLSSPPAVWRLAEAILVLAILGGLAMLLRSSARDLALRWPARWVVRWAVVGAVVLGPIGLVLGALLARPFFGTFSVELGDLRFLAPALVFAIANGVMEEVAYRGALMHWAGRVIGVWPAVVVQAVVFGLAHGGSDVGGSPLVLMTILGAGGFVAGLIAIRTKSLLVPIAWHVALDLPLYAYLACRAS